VELFKDHDLSLAQYNVLRILRGAGPAGATCSDVAGSLIRHDPDVTRLLDRLDARGLIERGRDSKDRRIVRTKITKTGTALLAELDEPVAALHARQLGHVSDKRLDELVALLDEARAGRP
jgi:DNA-binding MarR family transcriptional regulator